MRLILPAAQAAKISEGLRRARRREVGGVLMAEHVGANTFRIADVTVQIKGGTFAAFTRLVEDIIGPLRRFFEATKHEYTRFNYIGEWHSHHSFALSPSPRDHATMIDIVTDPDLGARFAILLLVRLDERDELEHTVTVYKPDGERLSGDVEFEGFPSLR